MLVPHLRCEKMRDSLQRRHQVTALRRPRLPIRSGAAGLSLTQQNVTLIPVGEKKVKSEAAAKGDDKKRPSGLDVTHISLPTCPLSQ